MAGNNHPNELIRSSKDSGSGLEDYIVAGTRRTITNDQRHYTALNQAEHQAIKGLWRERTQNTDIFPCIFNMYQGQVMVCEGGQEFLALLLFLDLKIS